MGVDIQLEPVIAEVLPLHHGNERYDALSVFPVAPTAWCLVYAKQWQDILAQTGRAWKVYRGTPIII